MSRLLKRRTTRESSKLLNQDPNVVKTVLDASVRLEIKDRSVTFVKTDEYNEILDKVVDWLTTDVKDGIYLCGVCGNGKTTFLNGISNAYNLFRKQDENGDTITIKLVGAREVSLMSLEDIKRLAKVPALAIDDLGTEPREVMNFGNVYEPMNMLLEERYCHRLMTLISSNIKPEDIKEIYGARIADRFAEMMYKVNFKNNSFRKR